MSVKKFSRGILHIRKREVFKAFDPENLYGCWKMKGWDFYNNKNALKKFNFFILGHHTSSTQLSSIREHGLLTNAMTEHKYVKKKDDIISDKNCI